MQLSRPRALLLANAVPRLHSTPLAPRISLNLLTRLQNMAATVRDIKAADFITKVLAIVSLRAILSACFLQLFSLLCVSCSSFVTCASPTPRVSVFGTFEEDRKGISLSSYHLTRSACFTHSSQVPVPQWVDTVKTSTANELAPYDENW